MWSNSQAQQMNSPVVEEKEQGKRKFDEISEMVEVAPKSKEELVEVPVICCDDVHQTDSGIKIDVKLDAKTNLETNPKSSSMKVQNEEGDIQVTLVSDVKRPKENIMLFSGKKAEAQVAGDAGLKPALPGSSGMPKKVTGRPPRPKRVVVQALLCEKKRKFKEFEPLIEEFINEVTLDLHKWVADKRQEILHKFKKSKYRAFFGDDGLETGPKHHHTNEKSIYEKDA
ncbi:hypothetical protein BVRB_8g185440 [Beta vulgaris subsp. vulgaris]|nr:hypothetical protein BVRB_8g185440 [Beta vulgaris subsp. vulgaris]